MHEFLRSRTAIQNDFKEQFWPGVHIEGAVHRLVINVLQPLRTEFQDWIYVLSGYRCERVNSHPEVGGSDNSDHMKGMAGDVTCKDTKGLYELAIALNLPYKQLIWYKDRNFVHISYDENNIRRQAWIQE